MDPAIDILRKGKSHAVAQDFTRELSEAWEWECNCTLALAEELALSANADNGHGRV